MKLLKSKKFLIVLAVIFVVITGYRLFGGNESKLEKQLIATLPSQITSCYYGERHPSKYTGEFNGDCIEVSDAEMQMFLVKDFTIERQITDGNMKFADCIIEMENENFKRIVYANLSCIRYDDGNWVVQSWSENSEPKMIAKNLPVEDDWDAKTIIANHYGFTNLTETNKNIDFDNGIITHMYDVNEFFEYLSIKGKVSCIRKLKRSVDEDEGYSWYRWDYDTEYNTEVTWDVLGVWNFESDGEPPYIGEIKLTRLDEQNAGTGTCGYPKWNHDINGFSGEYATFACEAHCYISGDTVFDAECSVGVSYDTHGCGFSVNSQGIESVWIKGAEYRESITLTRDNIKVIDYRQED